MHKEYFKEIFETSKSVIIPGLGSFSKTSPDDPKITFNPYLKFNDGFLAGFIAKKQNITMDEAGRIITENVEKINAALEQKGEALVLGLGTLKKTPDGKLEFTTDIQAGAHTPAPEVKKQEPKPDIKKPEEKPTVKPVDPPKPEVKPEIKPEKEKPVEKPVDPIKKDQPGMKVEAPGLTSIDANSKKKEDKKAKEPKAPKPPKPPKPPRAKGEKKKFPVLLVIILVVLVGAGTFTALQWDMVKGWIGMGEHKEVAEHKEQNEVPEQDTVATQPIDTAMVTEEPIVEEPVMEEIKKEPVKSPVKNNPPVQNNYATSGNFHVIVNCFSQEQNANRMVEKLKAEGHQGNNIGLRGGFYMVEAGSFSSMDEAKSKLEAVKSAYPKAWIYSGS